MHGDWKDRVIQCSQPQEIEGRLVFILFGALVETHINDQAHTQVPQVIVIIGVRGIPDKKVVGDFGNIHGAYLITIIRLRVPSEKPPREVSTRRELYGSITALRTTSSTCKADKR